MKICFNNDPNTVKNSQSLYNMQCWPIFPFSHSRLVLDCKQLICNTSLPHPTPAPPRAISCNWKCSFELKKFLHLLKKRKNSARQNFWLTFPPSPSPSSTSLPFLSLPPLPLFPRSLWKVSSFPLLPLDIDQSELHLKLLNLTFMLELTHQFLPNSKAPQEEHAYKYNSTD